VSKRLRAAAGVGFVALSALAAGGLALAYRFKRPTRRPLRRPADDPLLASWVEPVRLPADLTAAAAVPTGAGCFAWNDPHGNQACKSGLRTKPASDARTHGDAGLQVAG